MQIKGKKRLLNHVSEKHPDTPLVPIEERMKRVAAQKEIEEVRRVKKEIRLAEMQERSKTKRPIGRPPKDSDYKPLPPRQRYYILDPPPPPKEKEPRPSADYNNISGRESIFKKYGL